MQKKFDDLYLTPALCDRIKAFGFTQPTEVQQSVIPLMLQGHDVLGAAQTGTGKTASYVLPILEILNSFPAKSKMPRALVLVPTRELALQVEESILNLNPHGHITTCVLIGGASMPAQEKAIQKGPDVLIATPGRLLDLYEKGRILFLDMKLLVLDEADRMLDMGFMPDIKTLMSYLPPRVQKVLLSATMPKPIENFALSILDHPKRVIIAPNLTTAKEVTQSFIHVADGRNMDKAKRDTLRRLIIEQEIPSGIIFCNRKTDVDILVKSFNHHKIPAVGLHGDMSQETRIASFDMFKRAEVRFLIASDIAARGLDVEDLPAVINYNFPVSIEDYVHRVGRTGRAGATGSAWTFVTNKDGKKMERLAQKGKMEISYLEDYAITEAIPERKPRAPKEKAAPKQRKERAPSPRASRVRTQDAPAAKGFGENVPAFLRAPLPAV